mmetsp:Transcript_17290/g.35479  ORF Transcript_17290/g.35479 Transcript_17290/m.35479 type:complete len:97 (+) Transcript_17290:158-448(+)
MFAYTRTAATSLMNQARPAARRFASTAVPKSESTNGLMGWPLMKKVWFSDAGAYPVMAILVFACAFCTTIGTRCLLTNPDVRINMKNRQTVVRTWQ